jgi:hypothetical protein
MEKLVPRHVELTTTQGTSYDVVIVSYYVQFEANYFTASDHQFKGGVESTEQPHTCQ